MAKKGLVIGAVVAVAVIGAGVWFGRDAYATAHIGTTFVSKQTCSCLFVAKRTPASCATDYNPTDLERLTVTPGASDVTVTALGGLVKGRSVYEEGYGCHPVE